MASHVQSGPAGLDLRKGGQLHAQKGRLVTSGRPPGDWSVSRALSMEENCRQLPGAEASPCSNGTLQIARHLAALFLPTVNQKGYQI